MNDNTMAATGEGTEHRRLRESENLARAPWADEAHRTPLLARLLGIKRGYWEGWKDSHRAWYGEISFRSGFLFALSLGSFGRPHLQVAVPGVQIFFHLPHWRWLLYVTRGPHMENRQYGITAHFGKDWGGATGSIHCHWGLRYKILNMPWGWHKRKGDYRTEYLDAIGEWEDSKLEPKSWLSDEQKLEMGREPWSEEYPYHNLLLPSGEVQHVQATVTRNRTHRIYRVFGIPARRTTEHYIDVKFHEEMGSQRGSWKGGTVGMSHRMKDGETPGETIRRMQREVKFR